MVEDGFREGWKCLSLSLKILSLSRTFGCKWELNFSKGLRNFRRWQDILETTKNLCWRSSGVILVIGLLVILIYLLECIMSSSESYSSCPGRCFFSGSFTNPVHCHQYSKVNKWYIFQITAKVCKEGVLTTTCYFSRSLLPSPSLGAGGWLFIYLLMWKVSPFGKFFKVGLVVPWKLNGSVELQKGFEGWVWMLSMVPMSASSNGTFSPLL